VYYDILDSEQQMKSLSSNLDLQDSLYAKTALRVWEDLTREIDMNRIKVNISDLKVKRERLNTAIEQQKRYLQVLIGIPLDDDFLLDNAALTEVDFPEISFISDESMLSGKTELALLRQQKELNTLELKANRMQYSPTLSLVASGAYQFQSKKFRLNTKENWFKSAFIGLRLEIPVFDGAAKRHGAAQIRLRAMKLDNDMYDTEQSLRMERRNAQVSCRGTTNR
jgi:outer membrane protein TolC